MPCKTIPALTLNLAGVKKLQDIIRNGEFFVVLGSDETDDPRPQNSYIVTVEVTLIEKPKVDVEPKVHKFHISLDFPKNVNTQTLSTLIDKVSVRHSPASFFAIVLPRL